MRVLVTGASGFIGSQLMVALRRAGHEVVGWDSHRTRVSWSRKEWLEKEHEINVISRDLTNLVPVEAISKNPFDCVVHLAAKPGVRLVEKDRSWDIRTYTQHNLSALTNLAAPLTLYPNTRFIFASSSSVYSFGSTPSFYAATKLGGEHLIESLSKVGLNAAVVRPFTVYGPWGRPDMSIWTWTRKLYNNEEVRLNKNQDGSSMARSYTHVSDIVAGLIKLIESNNSTWITAKQAGPIDLGNSYSVNIEEVLKMLASVLGKDDFKVVERLADPGEARITQADPSKARDILGWEPKVQITEGTEEFAKWYKEQYLGSSYAATGVEN